MQLPTTTYMTLAISSTEAYTLIAHYQMLHIATDTQQQMKIVEECLLARCQLNVEHCPSKYNEAFE